ncbi:MAG: RloB family protein [Candidatus Methanoplasma sp.]|nr:RloB family protein [Candidatus Methanoplasma sp.]
MTREKGNRSSALFFIFTEGTRTEPIYFGDTRTFRKGGKAPRINPHAECRKGTCVNNMKEWVDELIKKKKIRKGDTVWIVIDKDQNQRPDLNRFRAWCRNNNRINIKIAFSNPQFELWYLLHFICVEEEIEGEKVIEDLSEKLGERYDKAKNYNSVLSPLMNVALDNADAIREDIADNKKCDCNPFTSVDSLVKDLKKYLRE